MAHGAYAKRRISGNRAPSVGAAGRSSRGNFARLKEWDKKAIRNQIRSIERLLKRALPLEIKTAHEKRLEDLKWQTELHVHRKMALRDRKLKFFERRKLERRIRRLEKKQHRLNIDHQTSNITSQLDQLKEDLEYVRFFPKTERYVSLFLGSDDEMTRSRRDEIRQKIKAHRATAAASGNELEETGSEDDEPMDLSEDDAFAEGSSSEDADDADDEWTDNKSSREETSRETGPSPIRQDDPLPQQRERREEFARVLMPPPRTMSLQSTGTGIGIQSRNRPSSSGRCRNQKRDISSSNSEDAMVRSTSSGVSINSSKIMEENEDVPSSSSSGESNASQLKKMRTGD